MGTGKNKAFSLTELLIVLVVVAVLFAALAPILTKRRDGSNIGQESVWYYVNDDDQMDAYYDSGVGTWTSTAYIGFNPAILGASAKSPLAKVVIKATKDLNGTNQHQIQFRYGSGNGVNAGSLYMDNKNNIMLAGYNEDFTSVSNNNNGYNGGNTIAGMGSFGNISPKVGAVLGYTTAFGAGAYRGVESNDDVVEHSAIAIGNNAMSLESRSGSYNTDIFIGANTGLMKSVDSGSAKYNIAIGSNSLSSPAMWPYYSVYLGFSTGRGSQTSVNTSSPNMSIYNVVAGSQYTAKATSSYNNSYNTILGYGAYLGGNPYGSRITAVGYGACSSFSDENTTTTGIRTCIGYLSGASKGLTNYQVSAYDTDNYEHIFLGGIPHNGFNGRSVLEVHNQTVTIPSSALSPQMSPTVVMNSNLVVRGNIFLPNDSGVLYSFKERAVSPYISTVGVDSTCAGSEEQKWRWSGVADATSTSSTALEYNAVCTSSLSDYSFGSTCPNLGVSSDARLKENISDTEDGLREIMALKPYTYTFKNDKKNTVQTGVIAQDLEHIFKSAVIKGYDGYLKIRWDEMFFASINAIKSLDKKLEKLSADITKAETDVQELKTSHKQLQKRIAALNSRAAKLER